MTTFWTYKNLARITAGTWRVPPADAEAVLPAASRADARSCGPVLWHDTRDLTPGQCYLAIQGENFDGHDFVEQAFKQGAAMAIVNADSPPQSSIINHQSAILEVPDTVAALQDLARAYRDELFSGGCKVIGVAGSNGKTTTRHLIHHVLTHAGKVGTQSPKSFNNHLGVPLTLLAARPTDDFVACEIGTNHPGEIDFLSAICRPDIAVITSIGEEHLEFFGDIEGVAREESDILKHIVKRGVAITPGPQVVRGELVWHYHRKCRDCVGVIRVNGFGRCEPKGFEEPEELEQIARATAEWRYCVVKPDRNATLFVNKFRFWHWEDDDDVLNARMLPISVPGPHNCFNAAYALLVAHQLGVCIDEATSSLGSASLPSQRMNIHTIGEDEDSVALIDDAYNANPDSVQIALRAMADLGKDSSERVVVVLGDMLELGDASESKHYEIGQQLAYFDSDYTGARQPCVGLVILIGSMIQRAAGPIEIAWTRSGAGRLHRFPEWTDDLPDQVAALLQPGDTVLLKASRGMRLERLIPAIEKRFGKPTPTVGNRGLQ
ncbi:UDP-N-acetylmuramoyl-tripeptide--D-alanyl-D-alanine ligase [Phycisphaeraceae bacterium D3-23]